MSVQEGSPDFSRREDVKGRLSARRVPEAEPAPGVGDASKVQFLRRLLAANDSTQAMQAAVDHLVEAIGCEVSWTGLIDGGYLVMGAHHGLASTEMASAWRLKVGEGIGGRTVAERRLNLSRDYRHDSRRVPLLKRLIDNEGILATLAVPLLVADSSIGVLYAAQHSVHDWHEYEEGIAVDIAHDLAVRLHQLHKQARTARDAAGAEQAKASLLRGVERSTLLAQGFSAQSDPTGALDLLAHELNARVELRGSDEELIRAAGHTQEGTPETVWCEEIATSPPLTVSVISAQGIADEQRAVADLCVALCRLQLLRTTERERAVERLRNEVFDQLLSGRGASPAELRQRAAVVGIDLTPGARVVVIGPADGLALAQSRADDLIAALSAAFESYTAMLRDGRLVAVIKQSRPPGQDTLDVLAATLEARAPRTRVLAGAGRECLEAVDYSMSYDEARAAFEVATRSGSEAPVTSAYELGILGVASLPVAHLRTTVRDLLGPITNSDDRRGTEYVWTLRTFLRNDRHLAQSAAALHVHYNTVRYRIAKIEALLQVDTRNADDRFRLETALRMHALIEALER